MGAVLQVLDVAPDGWAAVLAANVSKDLHNRCNVHADSLKQEHLTKF